MGDFLLHKLRNEVYFCQEVFSKAVKWTVFFVWQGELYLTVSCVMFGYLDLGLLNIISIDKQVPQGQEGTKKHSSTKWNIQKQKKIHQQKEEMFSFSADPHLKFNPKHETKTNRMETKIKDTT